MSSESGPSKRVPSRSSASSASGVSPHPSLPARSSGTARSALAVRRMDSLARVVHSYRRDDYHHGHKNPVVTAVGFEAPGHGTGNHGRLRALVGHNVSDNQQRDEDFRRLGMLTDVLHGRRKARDVARELAPTSGLSSASSKPDYAQQRLARDLRKLRKTFRGGDNRRGGGELHHTLHEAFDSGESYYDVSMSSRSGGTVHGETAVLASGASVGPVGVSKLSCHDCFAYGRRQRRSSDLRGSHGLSFNGWQDPETGHKTSAGYAGRGNQYASDSESDVEFSDSE